jgi:nucleoside diphosphate kinase
MIERAVVMVKPGDHEHLIDKLPGYFSRHGLDVLRSDKITFTPDMAKDFYPHIQATFGDEQMNLLAEYLASGPTTIFLVQGDNVISGLTRLKTRYRGINGMTKKQNFLHVSDTVSAAQIESEILGLER